MKPGSQPGFQTKFQSNSPTRSLTQSPTPSRTRSLIKSCALGTIFLGATFFLAVGAKAAPSPRPALKDFAGATPQPIGVVEESFDQLTIRFPSAINKGKLAQKEPFKVTCKPAVEGFSSWADNNSLWTYNFKAKDEYSSARLVGGSHCEVRQMEDLTSATGNDVWAAGSIRYSVTVQGPNVQEVSPAYGFKDSLRDREPVVLILFDGPVDRSRFFAEQSGFLSYLSSNAPAEKIPLVPVPPEQSEKLFSHFAKNRYFETEYKDSNWVLATVKPSLIPGAQISLTVQNQASAENPQVRSTKKHLQEFSVRSHFQAEVQCAHPSAKAAHCLPRSPITVVMNGRAKWTDVKKSYIEYIPYKSDEGKRVRSFPELNQEVSLWESFLDALSEYFPFLEKYNDTVVDSVVFKVNIEPESQATVVLPQNLQDIEGRRLANTLTEFHIRIGTLAEIIHVPQEIAVFEKNVPNLYLPVGIVNLNQKISIRKTGTDAKMWEPIQDVTSMIQVIRGYAARGNYRKTADYKSPLENLGLPNTVIGQQLTGARNRPNFLQFPFAEAGQTPKSGLYAIEISSPTFEAGRSDSENEQFYNPQYVLAQVTDLAVHLKKGRTHTLAWVTRLSEAQPVAGVDLQIYDCLGKLVQSLKTDASGVVSFPHREEVADCQAPEYVYSPYFSKDDFYISAQTGEDRVLTHSSWVSPHSYAFSAPGVEWFESDISENQVHYHAVLGVNLVKPGQQVPIEVIAKVPHAQGFREAKDEDLPTLARISSADDEEVYYELPLTWNKGVAHLVWKVPQDSSMKLGRYLLTLRGTREAEEVYLREGDLEVAEFKVPLMSGIISFPNQALVQPQSIPVSAVIRYANGVGAKNFPVDLSYYFEPTSLNSKIHSEFRFGSGPVKLAEDGSGVRAEILPRNKRPATLQGLRTGVDGTLIKDLALEKVADGRTLAEVLKTLDRPQKLVVRVRYQDQGGEYQTLSQSKDLFNASEYVGTSLVSGHRAQARLRAAVLDVNQNNKTALNQLEIKVLRVDIKVIGEELYGGLIKNTLEREIKEVRWNETCSLQKNIVHCPVGSLKAGNYAFQVTSRVSKQAAHTLFKVDAEGRVYGENDYYHFGDDEGNKQLPLALDKPAYKDGERAVVSFPSPFKTCRALVTLERSEVMESFIDSKACERGFVEIPVKADLAPNAFVSVYAITGRSPTTALGLGEKDLGRPTYRLGFANLKVNWSRFKSLVTVKTDKEKYQPGENVEVQVQVTPEQGVLQGGTVTLVAIEEKILELKENNTYKILDALMQLRGHSVSTVSPLEKVETVTADNSDLTDEEDSRKGGDEGGDGGSNAQADFKRKLFDALVTFQPAVPVENGVAKFSFKTNDSLTRFKIFAIATDVAQKFGTGEAVYLSEKDTQSYSNIPTVAHQGDQYPVKVTIQNNGAKKATYKTEVEAVIKDSSGKVIGRRTLSKQTDIPASTSEAVDLGDFTVSEEAARIEYEIRVYDENGKLVDAMSPEAQVILPTVPLSVQDSFLVLLEKDSFTQEFTKASGALPDKGELRVSLSHSLVEGALQQIRQRVQRDVFADFFLESQLHKVLLNSSEKHPEELKRFLETLVNSVDSNGFIKYSPASQIGSVWLTASVLKALQTEPWSLKWMPASLVGKLKGAISQVLSKTVDPIYIGKTPLDWVRAQAALGQGAFVIKDVALQTKAKALSEVIRSELQKNPAAYGPPLSQWSNSDLLNVWLFEISANPAMAAKSPLYAQLMGPSRLVYTGNMAQLRGKPHFGFFYSDETAETAQLLLGHSLLRQDKNQARSLALGLVNMNTRGWYNTPTMGGVAQGLKAFGRFYEAEAVGGFSVVTLPEQQVQKTVDWNKSKSLDVVAPWIQPKATVQISHQGSGHPWVGIQALAAVPLSAPRGQGLSIEKEIRNITQDAKVSAGSVLHAGDILEVSLNISSSGSVSHAALLDPIPAGSNILNEAYGDYSSGQKSYSGYKFYFGVLAAGITQVKYQFQLNNPGHFKLPPTRVEALYMPSVFGEVPNPALVVK